MTGFTTHLMKMQSIVLIASPLIRLRVATLASLQRASPIGGMLLVKKEVDIKEPMNWQRTICL